MKIPYIAGLQPNSGFSPDSRPSFVFGDPESPDRDTNDASFLSGHDPLQLPVAVADRSMGNLSSRKMMARHRSIDPTSRGPPSRKAAQLPSPNFSVPAAAVPEKTL